MQLRVFTVLLVVAASLWVPVVVHAEAEVTQTEATQAEESKLTKKEQRAARREALKQQVDALIQQDPDDEDYGAAERCIASNRIRSIDVLASHHVAIELSRKEYYLVQFENRCPGLRRGKSVMYESRSNRLCEFDALQTLDDFGFGRIDPGVKCFIPGFKRVSKEQVDSLKALLKNRPKDR